ncbi:MAG: MBL fold metallo-hydrolase, partial [Bacteroidales bacterium]
YLISIDKGYLLVDTGYAEDKIKFFKELSNHQIELNEIRFLFLTHHHDDHAGLLNDLIEQNPDIRIILNGYNVELLKNEVNLRAYGGAWCSKRVKKATEFYRLKNKKWTLSFLPYITRDTDIV